MDQNQIKQRISSLHRKTEKLKAHLGVCAWGVKRITFLIRGGHWSSKYHGMAKMWRKNWHISDMATRKKLQAVKLDLIAMKALLV